MDNWMKVLIAVACGVVILAGAAYGWGEWSQYQERRAADDKIERVRAELFRYAEAEPHEINEVRNYCEYIHSWIGGADDTDYNRLVRQLDRNCLILGYR